MLSECQWINHRSQHIQTFTDISEQNYFFFLKEHIDVQQLEWKEYKERQSERIRATFQKSDARNVWSAANYASSWETRPLLAARQCLVLTLFGAHVCLFVISLPRTRYNANRRTRSQAGGLWWKVLESVVSRNFSATSWTHPRFCQQQCCFLSLCVFCPSAFQRAQSKRTTHVLVCKIFFFFFLIQRWQQAKNRSFEGHIMAAKQTTKKDKNKNSMLFQKSYL